MDGSFILPAIILVPLIGAILTLFMGGEKQKYARIVAFVFTLITLGLTAIIMLGGDDLSQFDFSANWIDSAGLKMSLLFTVDGLSILMVFLTAPITSSRCCWPSRLDLWECTLPRITSSSTSCGRSP